MIKSGNPILDSIAKAIVTPVHAQNTSLSEAQQRYVQYRLAFAGAFQSLRLQAAVLETQRDLPPSQRVISRTTTAAISQQDIERTSLDFNPFILTARAQTSTTPNTLTESALNQQAEAIADSASQVECLAAPDLENEFFMGRMFQGLCGAAIETNASVLSVAQTAISTAASTARNVTNQTISSAPSDCKDLGLFDGTDINTTSTFQGVNPTTLGANTEWSWANNIQLTAYGQVEGAVSSVLNSGNGKWRALTAEECENTKKRTDTAIAATETTGGGEKKSGDGASNLLSTLFQQLVRALQDLMNKLIQQIIQVVTTAINNFVSKIPFLGNNGSGISNIINQTAQQFGSWASSQLDSALSDVRRSLD